MSNTLLLQLFQDFIGTPIYTIFNILMVDVFAESPSAAAAAASISICTLAASSFAAVQLLVLNLERGRYFTALAVVTGGIGSVIVWVIRKRRVYERVAKTAGETGRKNQRTLPGDTDVQTPKWDVAGAAFDRS